MSDDKNGGRVNGRPGIRSEDETSRSGVIDHAERARKRMAEIRALQGDSDMSDVYVDKFYAEAPIGWTYEWKLHSVLNKEYPQYAASLLRTGWSPVPANRVKHLLYPDYSDENVIIEGLMLYERPIELTEKRRQYEKDAANNQVRSKEAAMTEAPQGTAPRGTHPFTRPVINSSIGPAQIPD